MMPARWARGAVATRIGTGTLLLGLTSALTGCAALVPQGAVQPAAPVGNPQANAQPGAVGGDDAQPCPFLSTDDVAALAGDQRVQLVGSGNACSFNIGSQFTYQINVVPNDNDRFQIDRDKFFKDAQPIDGVGDEAFFRDGTAITTLGARKDNTFFTVTLIPAVADPNGGAAIAPPAAGGGQDAADDPDAALLAAADADDDGAIDADVDGDGAIDADADADAVAAADADGDGNVDDDVAAALDGVADNGNAAAGGDGAAAPVTNITEAKAGMTVVAAAVANNV